MKLQQKTLLLIAAVLNGAGMAANAESLAQPAVTAGPSTSPTAASNPFNISVPKGYQVSRFNVESIGGTEVRYRVMEHVDVLFQGRDRAGTSSIARRARLLSIEPVNSVNGPALEGRVTLAVSLLVTSEDSAKINLATQKGVLRLRQSEVEVAPTRDPCPACGMGGWATPGADGSIGTVIIGGDTYLVLPGGKLKKVDK